ncbi:Uncharacterised protein [Vibrio cholerae]|nr:Uncharacterised protein [Vibrio cholerae]CSC69658.1 Uncharacterised protein [Vibrio cholerae]
MASVFSALATKVSAVWGFLSVNCHFTPLVVALAQRIRFLWFWMWVRITRNVLLTLCTWAGVIHVSLDLTTTTLLKSLCKPCNVAGQMH